METATLTMLPRHARTEVERYAKCKNLTKRDQVILKAYKSIARGGKVIDLHESIRLGGANEHGVPKLAVCRASSTKVDLQIMPGLLRFSSDVGYWSRRTLEMPNPWRGQSGSLWAGTPFIPPYLRPADLSDCFILWEATWRDRPKGDPMLLRHVGKNLYRVIAAWDLTPVEAAVIS